MLSSKKQHKKSMPKYVFDYKTIEGVPNKYLDYLLVQITSEKLLKEFFTKEKETPMLKGIKFKHKVNKSFASLDIDKLRDVALDYISVEKTRHLYSFITGANITMLEDFMEDRGFDFVKGDRDEFLENLQTLMNVINIPNIITYLRIQREDLHDLIPWLLAKWEESDDFRVRKIEDTYGFEPETINLDAFDLDIDFDICDLDEEDMEELSSLNLVDSMLFNKGNIKNTIFIMKECLDVLGKKVEEKEEEEDKLKELEKLANDNKKVIAKLEKKLKSRDIRVSALENENEELIKELENVRKKLEQQEEANKQNKVKIEELKKEKREINKQNKSKLDELEMLKTNLASTQQEMKEMKNKESELDSIKKEYKKSLEEVENAKNQCIELQGQLYAIKKEKEEVSNIYENKLQELTNKLQLANEKEIPEIKNEPSNNSSDDINEDEFLGGFDDFGDLFGDALDNNPTYSR